jgi:hypothetical protein
MLRNTAIALAAVSLFAAASLPTGALPRPEGHRALRNRRPGERGAGKNANGNREPSRSMGRAARLKASLATDPRCFALS